MTTASPTTLGWDKTIRLVHHDTAESSKVHIYDITVRSPVLAFIQFLFFIHCMLSWR